MQDTNEKEPTELVDSSRSGEVSRDFSTSLEMTGRGLMGRFLDYARNDREASWRDFSASLEMTERLLEMTG